MTLKLTPDALLFSATATAAFPVTVTSCNREVTFDAAPRRAISIDVNLTAMMLVLGLRDSMVGHSGISGWKTLDPEMVAGVAELPELSALYPRRNNTADARAVRDQDLRADRKLYPHPAESQDQHGGYVRRSVEPWHDLWRVRPRNSADSGP